MIDGRLFVADGGWPTRAPLPRARSEVGYGMIDGLEKGSASVLDERIHRFGGLAGASFSNPTHAHVVEGPTPRVIQRDGRGGPSPRTSGGAGRSGESSGDFFVC